MILPMGVARLPGTLLELRGRTNLCNPATGFPSCTPFALFVFWIPLLRPNSMLKGILIVEGAIGESRQCEQNFNGLVLFQLPDQEGTLPPL